MKNKEAQSLLIKQRLLDPPADGAWGKQSVAALREFQFKNQLPIGTLDDKTKAVLSKAPEPILNCGSDLAGRIIRYMLGRGYWVPIGENQCTIAYVEGMEPNGVASDDAPNEWNDSRLVIDCSTGTPKIVSSWTATTEPGDHYTYYPMNSSGAFRIKFGQYKAWQVGVHGNSDPHEALVQVGAIEGYRDYNQDFLRTGDQLVEGLFGVNQHWGYDLEKVENASAGCLVGRYRSGHKEFMNTVKQDRRYLTDPSYTFYTAVLPGDEI